MSEADKAMRRAQADSAKCPACLRGWAIINGACRWGCVGGKSADSERFWARATKTDGCWIWNGTRDANGYGKIGILRRMYLAHRVAWKLTNGVVPDGMEVCHRCDTPPCVRPDHLFLGTQADNMRDMTAKGRHVGTGKGLYQRRPELLVFVPRGESHGKAVLTGADVRSIRAAYLPPNGRHGGNSASLAARYGVTKRTINQIISRETWRHI